jgi:hypothetical protein
MAVQHNGVFAAGTGDRIDHPCRFRAAQPATGRDRFRSPPGSDARRCHRPGPAARTRPRRRCPSAGHHPPFNVDDGDIVMFSGAIDSTRQGQGAITPHQEQTPGPPEPLPH